MRILPADLSENTSFQSHLPEARAFSRENRVYKVKLEEGELKAYVLGDEPMPHEVVLRFRKEAEQEEQLFWSCECGSAEPCVHLASLIIRSSDLDLDSAHWLKALGSTVRAEKSHPDSVAGDEGGSLFGDDLFGRSFCVIYKISGGRGCGSPCGYPPFQRARGRMIFSCSRSRPVMI